MAAPPVTTTPAKAPASGGGGALPKGQRFGAERIFRSLATSAGSMVLVIIVAIAIFLIVQAIPSLRQNAENFFTYQQWNANDTPPRFGIAAIAFGTIMTSSIA